ncbi:MAG: transcriptional regulator [Variovorax sp.]|nr:MAG: transcriptional regulator [Variovorax sp.]
MSFLRGGGTWVDLGGPDSRFHEGLPPAMAFAAPSGYLGVRIAKVVATEIGVPSSLRDWSDGHRVKFLCAVGSDVAGSLMWGANSFAVHMASRQSAPIATADIGRAYQELASATTQTGAGSSAGGEQPKFTCETEARGHLIVKFARVGTRSSEMLILEELALQALDEAGVEAAPACYFESDGYGFLEVERFDRVGRFGRRGLISAGAIDDELFGMRDNWPSFAQRCEEAGMLGPNSVRQVLVLTAFSELIGNGDRHFENLSLMTDERGQPIEVSPAYDMLPMMYASVGGGIEPELRLVAPSFQSLGARPDVWEQAFQAAHAFWTTATADPRLSAAMREISARNARHVAEVVAPLLPAREDADEGLSNRYE